MAIKTNLDKIFHTDEVAEKEGFELEVFDGDVVIKIMLARAGGANKKFAARLEARMKPYKRKAEAGQLEESISEDILVRTIAETLILGWVGISDEDGEEVPYTTDNAVELLKALPNLRDLIFEEAQRISNFQQIEREEGSGN